MYWLVKLVQSLVKALNSEGTPTQVAAGIAIGSCLGLTPLISLHNLVVVAAILLLRVSVPGATLGWLLFTPVGFLLDPVFDALGTALLTSESGLRGLWVLLYNSPVLALGNPTNTIVLGSLVGWVLLSIPIFLAMRWGVARYRSTIYERYKDARLFRAVRASKLYGAYRLLRPGS